MSKPMNISDEAVEAAARAIRDDDWPDHEDQIHHPVKDYMSNARAALAAAAPHLTGAAWEEGYGHGYKHGYSDCLRQNGYSAGAGE